MNRLIVTFKLFKFPFIVILILYTLTSTIFLLIISIKDSYKLTLKEEFATKQPHIKISFIQNQTLLTKTQLEAEKNRILKLSNQISNIVAFVEGKSFYTSTASMTNSNSFYNGDIKIIGLETQSFIYNFYNLNFMKKEPFYIKYTPLEFIYIWQNPIKNSEAI